MGNGSLANGHVLVQQDSLTAMCPYMLFYSQWSRFAFQPDKYGSVSLVGLVRFQQCMIRFLMHTGGGLSPALTGNESRSNEPLGHV